MTNGIKSQSFLGMASGVTPDFPITSYTPTPIPNPNWYNPYGLYQYTPPYLYHPPQPPEYTPQTPHIFYHVRPPPHLYTPPFTLTRHTLSTGQSYYAIETGEDRAELQKSEVSSDSVSEFPPTPTHVSKHVFTATLMFDESPERVRTVVSMPVATELIRLPVESHVKDVECDIPASDEVGSGNIVIFENKLGVNDDGVGDVSVLGENVGFKGSGDACDEGFELFKEGEENWDTTKGYEPWNQEWDWDDDMEEDGIVEEKGEMDDVENNDSDDDIGLFGYALKVFGKIPEPQLDVDVPQMFIVRPEKVSLVQTAIPTFHDTNSTFVLAEANKKALKVNSPHKHLNNDKIIVYKLHENEYGQILGKLCVIGIYSMTAPHVFDKSSETNCCMKGRYQEISKCRYAGNKSPGTFESVKQGFLYEVYKGMVHKVVEMDGFPVKDKVAWTPGTVRGLDRFDTKLHRNLVDWKGGDDDEIMCCKLHEAERGKALTGVGGYSFTNIIPKKYNIRLPIAVKDSTKVELGFGNMVTDDIFLVFGYDIHGLVVVQGNPLLGVHIYLYSNDVLEINCPHGFGDTPGENNTLYHDIYDADGVFIFKSIPCWVYKMIPYYKGENIVFDVSPLLFSVSIQHGHVTISQKFQVIIFYVGGHVVDGNNMRVGVKVLSYGQEKSITDKEGFYKLGWVPSKRYLFESKKAIRIVIEFIMVLIDIQQLLEYVDGFAAKLVKAINTSFHKSSSSILEDKDVLKKGYYNAATMSNAFQGRGTQIVYNLSQAKVWSNSNQFKVAHLCSASSNFSSSTQRNTMIDKGDNDVCWKMMLKVLEVIKKCTLLFPYSRKLGKVVKVILHSDSSVQSSLLRIVWTTVEALEELYISRLYELLEIEGLEMAVGFVLNILFNRLSIISKETMSGFPIPCQAALSSTTKPIYVVAAMASSMASLTTYLRNPVIQVGAARLLSMLFFVADYSQVYIFGNTCFGRSDKQIIDLRTEIDSIPFEQSLCNEVILITAIKMLTTAEISDKFFRLVIVYRIGHPWNSGFYVYAQVGMICTIRLNDDDVVYGDSSFSAILHKHEKGYDKIWKLSERTPEPVNVAMVCEQVTWVRWKRTIQNLVSFILEDKDVLKKWELS